jgi:hypothetical protein
MEPCSTRAAAKKLGISLVTLQRRIANKSVTAPKIRMIGGIRVRLWTEKEIEKARRQLTK